MSFEPRKIVPDTTKDVLFDVLMILEDVFGVCEKIVNLETKVRPKPESLVDQTRRTARLELAEEILALKKIQPKTRTDKDGGKIVHHRNSLQVFPAGPTWTQKDLDFIYSIIGHPDPE